MTGGMKRLAMHWQILISLLAAVLLGTFLKSHPDSAWTQRLIEIGELFGSLFMQALKMIIVPLIVSSIIAGISSLSGFDGLRRMGAKTLGFYLLTTLCAVIVGLAAVNLFQPGMTNDQPNPQLREIFEQTAVQAPSADKERFTSSRQEQAGDWKQLFLRLFPSNILDAGSDNGSLLGVLSFSLLFGIAMTTLPPDTMAPLRAVFTGLNDVMIQLTHWIMACAPVGIFGLMLGIVFRTGLEVFEHMWLYAVTVLIALAVHLFIVLPLILRYLAKVSPLAHFRAMRTALLTAFSTASSSGTLPITMRCVQEKAGVSKRVASFTLPLGATVNMDGTALYECIAVLFVAQVMGIELDVAGQMLVVISALLTSIGVAGVPSASLVAILIILNNAQIPNADIAILTLFSVDRLLDMCRTAVNVFGDSCAAVTIAKSEGESLKI